MVRCQNRMTIEGSYISKKKNGGKKGTEGEMKGRLIAVSH